MRTCIEFRLKTQKIQKKICILFVPKKKQMFVIVPMNRIKFRLEVNVSSFRVRQQ